MHSHKLDSFLSFYENSSSMYFKLTEKLVDGVFKKTYTRYVRYFPILKARRT